MEKKEKIEHGTKKSMEELAQFAENEKRLAWAKQVRDALNLIDLENIPKILMIFGKRGSLNW